MEIKRFVPYLFLGLCTAIFYAHNEQQVHGLWNRYETIFEGRLDRVFASEDALVNAHEFAGNASASTKAMTYVCASYVEGAAIATEIQSNGKKDDVTLLPILVDESSDLICFLSVKPEGGKSPSFESGTFTFEINNPSPLKIHSNIYEAIEDATRSIVMGEMDNLLTVFFRPEFFDPQLKPSNLTYENDAAGFKHFASLIRQLSGYSPNPFNTFYWTAPKTKEFYATHEGPLDFERDRDRAERWNELAGYFSNIIGSDECHFAQLATHAVFQPGKVELPLRDVVATADPTLAASCLAYLVAAVASEPSVNFLDFTRRVELLNFRSRSIQQSATASSSLSASPYTQKGLMGEGHVVQVTDTGVDSKSCYFIDPQGTVPPSDITTPIYDTKYRKIIEYSYNGCGDTGDQSSGHGTHVSGTILGSMINADIENAGKYAGNAPSAKLVFVDLGKPGTGLCIPSANELYKPGDLAGARVFSNSWGNTYSGSGYYASQDTDLYLFKRPQSLVLFAAGNSGQQGLRTLTQQAAGKNNIAVGSSETTYGGPNITYVAFYSSQGPTYDGRIKPDLVAPGDQLMSAQSNGANGASCQTLSMTGTSMATPSAAGASLLVRDYFSSSSGAFWTGACNKNYPFCRAFLPSGVLIKAVLLNGGSPQSLFHGGGAKDVKLGPPPDVYQGFGRVTLRNVLPLPGVYDGFDLFVDDLRDIKAGQTLQYTAKVASSDVSLTATLVWYDAPNVGGTTTKALVQDLDLTVTTPAGKTLYGNGGSAVDTLNTVEQISVPFPATGAYRVYVTAKALPYSGSQQYSIAITCNGKVATP